MSIKNLFVGRITAPKTISDKLTVVSVAKGEGENATFTEVKLTGRALEAFNANGLNKGAKLGIYAEEQEENYTTKAGEETSKKVYFASSLYAPVDGFKEGKTFVAGRFTEPKVISEKLTVVSLATGKDENLKFHDIKLTGVALSAFKKAGLGKGSFVGLSGSVSVETFTTRAGEEVKKEVFFPSGILTPVHAPK